MRRLLNVLTALSLLLFLAACVLWARGRSVADYLDWITPGPPRRVYGVTSADGLLWLGIKSGGAAHPRGDVPRLRLTQYRFPSGRYWSDNAAPGRLGIKYIRADHQFDEGPLHVRAFVVRYDLLTVCLAVLPILRVIHYAGRRRRTRRGLCPACGYDLRATPGRCPECGNRNESVGNTGVASSAGKTESPVPVARQ